MLTDTDLLHIAKLARLRVEHEDLPRYSEQVGSILEYIAKLQELDTEGIPELAHGAGLSNVFRVDEVISSDRDVQARIIAAFPHKEGNLLEVPAVFSDRTE